MKHFALVLAAGIAGCQPTAGEAPPVTSGGVVASETPTAAVVTAVPMVPATFADVVERVRPAVVNIYTRKRVATNRFMMGADNRLVPEERLAESLGSGFIIDAEGHVLTNFHVIDKAEEIEVRLFDERWFRARVVGDDAKSDVALLKLEQGADLPVLPLGDSDALRVGDWVMAIGNPLGLTSTVTVGIASATGRKRIPMGGDLRFQDFIQTDASINPGNSGGPLVSLAGTVVGINTAVNSSAQGIGFAIPANMVAELLPRLKEGGHVQRSWLGIYVDDVPKGLRVQLALPVSGGALVTGVVKGGPAEVATLRPGDVILQLDGHEVVDSSKLAWLAGNVGVGKSSRLSVQRGNERLELEIRMGAQPE